MGKEKKEGRGGQGQGRGGGPSRGGPMIKPYLQQDKPKMDLKGKPMGYFQNRSNASGRPIVQLAVMPKGGDPQKGGQGKGRGGHGGPGRR